MIVDMSPELFDLLAIGLMFFAWTAGFSKGGQR
jgi:hypothetical protein